MVIKKIIILFILVLPTNGFQSWLTFLWQFLISFLKEISIVRGPSVNVVCLYNALIRFKSFCMEFLRFPYIVLLESTKLKNWYFQKNLLDYCWNLECVPQKSPFQIRNIKNAFPFVTPKPFDLAVVQLDKNFKKFNPLVKPIILPPQGFFPNGEFQLLLKLVLLTLLTVNELVSGAFSLKIVI